MSPETQTRKQANRARYQQVPAKLPQTLPPVDRKMAQRLATLITRQFWPKRGHSSSVHPERHYQYPVTAVRRCWLSPRPTAASNSDKGLGRLVHDLSHDVFAAWYPRRAPHDPLHVHYEEQVAAYVAAWLARQKPPAPKAKPAKPSAAQARSARLERCQAGIARWEAKARRAATALRKLRAQERGLVRAQKMLDTGPAQAQDAVH